LVRLFAGVVVKKTLRSRPISAIMPICLTPSPELPIDKPGNTGIIASTEAGFSIKKPSAYNDGTDSIASDGSRYQLDLTRVLDFDR